MAAPTNNRLWQWAAILLLLCNTGLILTMWLKPKMANDQARRETPRDFVIRNLKFTDKQVTDYDALIHEHRAAMNKLHDDMKRYRESMFATLSRADSNDADSLAKLIAKDQQETELVTYRHFARVRELCTSEQKTEFDKIINDVIGKMNGPGRPPRDGHRPPPGEGGPPEDHDGPAPPPDGH